MRNRPFNYGAAIALAVLLASGAVQAQDEAMEEEAVGFQPSVEFSGFVDTSVFYPISNTGADGDIVISLDQVELDVMAAAAPGLTLRTDLNVFPSAGAVDYDSLLEQGYLKYYFNQASDGLFFLAGKMNAPIGVEFLDPVDMYQFSQGLLFSFATPSNLTGFFGGYEGDSFTAMLYLTNDWDTTPAPENYLVGGRLAYGFDFGLDAGVSVTYGPFGVGRNSLLMVDVDLVYGAGDLTLFAEVNVGLLEEAVVNEAGDEEDTSLGFLIKANYAILDSLSVTVRYDYLDRPFDPTFVGIYGGAGMTVTGAILYTITENFGALAEIRADIPDSDSDLDTPLVGALEFTAMF